MRGPTRAWAMVQQLAAVCGELLDAHGRTLSLADVKRLREKLAEVVDVIDGSEECERP